MRCLGGPYAHSSPTETDLLALIQLAYAAAENPGGWDTFLLALCEAVAARTGVLMWHHLLGAGGIASGARNDPEAQRLYGAHYAHIDPFALSPVTRAAGLLQPLSDEALIPHGALRQTPYYNEFGRRFDLCRLATVVLKKEGAAFSGISLLRGTRDDPSRMSPARAATRSPSGSPFSMRASRTARGWPGCSRPARWTGPR